MNAAKCNIVFHMVLTRRIIWRRRTLVISSLHVWILIILIWWTKSSSRVLLRMHVGCISVILRVVLVSLWSLLFLFRIRWLLICEHVSKFIVACTNNHLRRLSYIIECQLISNSRLTLHQRMVRCLQLLGHVDILSVHESLLTCIYIWIRLSKIIRLT